MPQGVNAAYPWVQCRYVWMHGELAFADMPLLFWAHTAVTGALSFLTNVPFDTLIPWVFRLSDALSLALFLPALLLFNKARTIPAWLLLAVTILVACSPFAFGLFGDMHKNAWAMLGLLLTIGSWYRYLHTRSRRWLVWCMVALLCTTLTHFGTAAVLWLYFLVMQGTRMKRRANLGIFVAIGIAVGLLFYLDPTRAGRLANAPFELFQSPFGGLIAQAPPTLLIWLGAGLLAFVSWRHRHRLGPGLRPFVSLLVASLALAALPFEQEYTQRLTLFMLPALCLFLFSVQMAMPMTNWSRTGLALCVVGSLLWLPAWTHPKRGTPQAVLLQEIAQASGHPWGSGAIVVAPHGLEWWVAWHWQVPVSNKPLSDAASVQYQTIYRLEADDYESPSKPNTTAQRNHEPPGRLVFKQKHIELWQTKP